MVGAQPVVFKLLQAVRLTVDGSAESANAVGGDAAFMAKAVEWGAGGGMAEGVVGVGGGGGGSQGVRSEAARLIAAVVKNGKSKEVSSQVRYITDLQSNPFSVMAKRPKSLANWRIQSLVHEW